MKLSRPNYREAFASRIRHDRLQQTHVVVGDHEPEPRIDWDALPRSGETLQHTVTGEA